MQRGLDVCQSVYQHEVSRSRWGLGLVCSGDRVDCWGKRVLFSLSGGIGLDVREALLDES